MTACSHPLRRALSTNSAATGFTAKVPVATKPSGSGVVDVFDGNLGYAIDTSMPKYLQVVPFGTDTNNTTFDMRVWGWNKVHNPGGTDHDVWIPQLLLDLTVTLGSISGTAIAASHLMADTITINQGDTDAANISTADDTPASILVHMRGCELIEFDFDLTGAAAANCYWRLMDQN